MRMEIAQTFPLVKMMGSIPQTTTTYSPDLQTNPSILSQLSPLGCLETEVRYAENQSPLLLPPEYMDSVHIKTELPDLLSPCSPRYDLTGNLSTTLYNDSGNVG